MGPLGLIALLSGLMLATTFNTDSEDVAPDTPDEGDGPDEPDVTLDTGATFAQSDDGVEIDVGADETGSVAVIYYIDTEDREDPDEFTQVDEARFYLVPEGVDWSDASWETQGDIPGAAEYAGNSYDYELADFEDHFGLDLLGVVDLKGIPSDTEEPGDRVGGITSNAPIEEYYLEANTDGDELVTFLPKDYVITRDGVAETPVFEDTTGTDQTEWYSADADGIIVDGAGGNDYLETANNNVTLIGGLGDDSIDSQGIGLIDPDNLMGTVVEGGEGDDEININNGTAYGGEGADRVTLLSGTAYGGAGNDRLVNYGDGPGILYGGADDDSVSASGAGSQAYGDAGNDFIGVTNGATGYGGAGDDRLQVDSGTTAYGGAGDDLFTAWYQFRDEEGPATVTGGMGADTFYAEIRNAANGEADDIFLNITDFDTTEDVLQLSPRQITNASEQIEIVEAEDGSHTDIRLTIAGVTGLEPGIAVIRLDGTTGVTAAHIVITELV